MELSRVEADGYTLVLVASEDFDGSIGQKAVIVKRTEDKEEKLFEMLCDGYYTRHFPLTEVPFGWTEELRVLSSRRSIDNKLPRYTITPPKGGEAGEIALLFKSMLDKGDSDEGRSSESE